MWTADADEAYDAAALRFWPEDARAHKALMRDQHDDVSCGARRISEARNDPAITWTKALGFERQQHRLTLRRSRYFDRDRRLIGRNGLKIRQ